MRTEALPMKITFTLYATLSDYLPAGQDPADGFAPNSEQPARLVFNLTQAKAAGFRVYLFYP